MCADRYAAGDDLTGGHVLQDDLDEELEGVVGEGAAGRVLHIHRVVLWVRHNCLHSHDSLLVTISQRGNMLIEAVKSLF